MNPKTPQVKEASFFRRRGGWALLAFIAVLAAGYWAFNSRSIHDSQTDVIESPRSAASSPQLKAFASSAPQEVTAPEKLKVTMQPGESRADAVNRWAKGSPAEALLAYRELNRCDFIRKATVYAAQHTDDPSLAEELKGWPSEAQACEGLQLGQLTMRRDLLVKAGEAAVPGAYEAMLWYGGMVIGYGEQVDQAQFDADIKRISDANVKAAIPGALAQKSLALAMCTDPDCKSRDLYMSRVYEVAQFEQDPKVASIYGDKAAKRALADLGPERAARAIEEGKALVAAARNRQ